MVIKLRFRNGPEVTRGVRKNRRLALAAATLLMPAVLTAAALGFWKLAADLGAAGPFAIRDGLFSHWQVWLAVAALAQFSATLLNRYGSRSRSLQNPEGERARTILNSEFGSTTRK